MLCPHCNAAVQGAPCSTCGRNFDKREAERLGQLVYLLSMVDLWRTRGLLNRATAAAIAAEPRKEIADIRAAASARPAVSPAVAAPTHPRIRQRPRPNPPEAGSTVDRPTPPSTIAARGGAGGNRAAAASPLLPVAAASTTPPPPSTVGENAMPLLPLVAATPTTAPPPPLVAAGAAPTGPVPATPAPPPLVATPVGPIPAGAYGPASVSSGRPRLVWRQVGLSLLSDRALNTLLLVGALLVLASATVISTLNPTHLRPLIHLVVMIATTVAFFAVGQALRTRFGLARSGSALLTISAAFLPLDIWTLGQGGLLHQSVADTVLTASVLCLAVYLLIHVFLRERDRLFAVLATLAGASTALALAYRVALPLSWWTPVLTVLALAYALVAPRLHALLPTLAETLLSTAHALALGSLTVLTLVAATAFTGVTLYPVPGPSLAASWWLGTLFYAVYGRVGGGRYYLSVAASLSAVAALVTLQLLPVLGPWTGVAVAALACVYMTIGDRRSRPAVGTLPEPAFGRALRALLGQWPYQIALALSVVALLWPVADASSRAAASGVLAVLYASSARQARGVRGPLWGAIAVALLPLTLLYLELALPLANALPAWTLLALGAVAVGEAAARGAAGTRLWSWASVWRDGAQGLLSPFARPLLGLGYGTAAIVLGIHLVRSLNDATASDLLTSLTEGQGPVTTVLAALTGGAAVVALLRGAPRTLFLAAALAVAPVVSLTIALARPLGGSSAHVMQSGALMGLALLYLVTAVWLENRIGDEPSGAANGARAAASARSLYPLAYTLSVLATLLVMGDPAALKPIFGLLLAAWAWSAYRVAIGRHTLFLDLIATMLPDDEGGLAATALFGALCAWLLPLWLLDAFMPWESSYSIYGLALSVLAVPYLAGSRYLARRAPAQAWPWSSAGIVLIALGPLLAVSEPVPRLLSAALALGLCTAMARLTRRPGWLVEIALALPLLAFAVLNVSGASLLDLRYYPLVFLPIFAFYLVVGNRLRHDGAATASSWPFDLVAYVGLCLLSPAILLGSAADTPLITTLTATVYTLVLFVYTERAGKRAWRPQIPLQSIRWSAWVSVAYCVWTLEALLWLCGLDPSLHPIGWAVAALSVAALAPRARPVWKAPLGWGALVVASVDSFWALIQTEAAPDRASAQILLITLALAGLQIVTVGYQRRERGLIYGGVAAILGVYLGQLVLATVTQPQFFVAPAGLYLLGLAFAERRVAPRKAQTTAKLLEITGLLLILGTSLLQAAGYATAGLPAPVYDLVVLAEGLILLWLGDMLRWKDTSTAGALALIADALLIFAHPLRAVNTWYAVALAGLAIIFFVIVVEKKRQSFAKLFGQWRRMRETWD